MTSLLTRNESFHHIGAVVMTAPWAVTTSEGKFMAWTRSIVLQSEDGKETITIPLFAAEREQLELPHETEERLEAMHIAKMEDEWDGWHEQDLPDPRS